MSLKPVWATQEDPVYKQTEKQQNKNECLAKTTATTKLGRVPVLSRELLKTLESPIF